MPLDPNIILQSRGPDIAGSFSRALQGAQGIQQFQQNQQLQPFRTDLLKQKVAQGEELSKQLVQKDIATGMTAMQGFLKKGDLVGAKNILDSLNLSQPVLEKLKAGFTDENGLPETAETLSAQVENGLAALSPQKSAKSVRQREFETLTHGLPEDEVGRARRIRLGLSPRAVGAAAKNVTIGGVDYTFDPVAQEYTPVEIDGERVTASTISESRAQIESNIVTARENAKNASGIVKDGFQNILGINKNIRNIDKAIDALNRNARTGVINSFLPSIRAASIELDQIRNELALDVVGATTFGALSAGELALAQQVALPTKLGPEKLKEHLIKRRDAQVKLSAYFNEQIKFLGQKDEKGIPNTVGGFIEMKERELARGKGEVMFDANGNRARVFSDGTFEEF